MSATYQRPRFVTAKEQAALLRQTIKVEFPGVRFSVRCSRGSAIDVRWVDGPRGSVVDEVCQRYRGGGFDGMQDLRYSIQTLLSTDDGFERVQFSADFVFTHREMSHEWRAELIAELAALDPIAAMPESPWTPINVLVDREGVPHRAAIDTTYLADAVHQMAAQRDR